MFSGIIEGTGKILQKRVAKTGLVFRITSPFSLKQVSLGDSIAVNGCCLTVVKKGSAAGLDYFEADVSEETLSVTSLGDFQEKEPVNLERALRLGDRLGGHLVQGHVDGVGQVKKIKEVGLSWEYTLSFPESLRKYIIPKGSITIDGISLTVNRLKPKEMTLVIIPHTRKLTNLQARRVGDRVNLEVDLVGKFIESLTLYSKGFSFREKISS